MFFGIYFCNEKIKKQTFTFCPHHGNCTNGIETRILGFRKKKKIDVNFDFNPNFSCKIPT